LVEDGEVWSLDSSGALVAGANVYQTLSTDPNSIVSDPITVDYNLDYQADAVYFGTISGDAASASGKLRRIEINNSVDEPTNPANWVGDSVLFTANQPISAAPSVGIDKDFNRWVFVGTGRYYVTDDALNTQQQSFYGIKEPGTYNSTTGEFPLDFTEVLKADMFDATPISVSLDETVTGLGGVSNWDELLQASRNADGWYLDFSTSGERNLGQAALLGGLLTWTTYIPSDDACSYEGYSNLYATFFTTGTSYHKSVIGTDDSTGKPKRKVTLGKGLALTPNIHVGRQSGSTAFIQTSTGAIETVEQINPGLTKSGIAEWRELWD
jgi:type IV pilus assembly protein PilY1